jgi:ribonuclease Y
MNIVTLMIVGIVALVGGAIVGYVVRKFVAKNQVNTAEGKAGRLLDEAKIKAKEQLLDAKDKGVRILEEVKKEESKRRGSIQQKEDRLEQKEQKIDQKISKIEKDKNDLERKAGEIKNIREEVLKVKEQQVERLEKIAEMKKEDAQKVLMSVAEKAHKDEITKGLATMERDKKETLEEKAKDIMVLAMQRYAGSHSADTTTTTISIASDELKGRIIGREGRNIKAIERLTGAEIIVDDTPEAIVISAFNPIRRETARLTLEKLLEDGRIHPTKIEEAVKEAKELVSKRAMEAGEAAVYDVGIAGFDPKLTQLLGRLRYRTSFGQNVLLHSLEVAHLAGHLASELGLDTNLAKKAGLLHDIGKAVDAEVQGTHVELGISILKKFKQSEEVINAMKSHHEDYPFEDNYSLIIAAADALSASRPGARKDTLENYLKRLEEIEDTANSFSEVNKCYAIQAGREIRVFANPEKVDDLGAIKLAKSIAEKIETDLKYPGEIKVNLLRETKAVEYAR